MRVGFVESVRVEHPRGREVSYLWLYELNKKFFNLQHLNKLFNMGEFSSKYLTFKLFNFYF